MERIILKTHTPIKGKGGWPTAYRYARVLTTYLHRFYSVSAFCRRIITKKNKKRKFINCGVHDPINVFRKKVSIAMNYDDFLENLFRTFPEIERIVKDEGYLEGLPHCICDIIFVPYIITVCNSGFKGKISKICEFLEEMAQSLDIKVKEVLNVSILEPLVLDENNVIGILQNNMGGQIKKELQYWKEKYLE